jgi:hypothetical protein
MEFAESFERESNKGIDASRRVFNRITYDLIKQFARCPACIAERLQITARDALDLLTSDRLDPPLTVQRSAGRSVGRSTSAVYT